MDELIFHSFPGAIVVIAVVLIFPALVDSDGKVLLLAFLSPLIGYIVHQIHRWIFEITGGFGRESRSAIRYIRDSLAPKEAVTLSTSDAFLVWEISIYDSRISSSFLSHDAKSWHYTLAFWSTSLASLVSSLIVLAGWFLQKNTILLIGSSVFLLLFIFFLVKGNSTYRSLKEQEIAFIKVNEEIFVDVMKKIKLESRKSYPAKHAKDERQSTRSKGV